MIFDKYRRLKASSLDSFLLFLSSFWSVSPPSPFLPPPPSFLAWDLSSLSRSVLTLSPLQGGVDEIGGLCIFLAPNLWSVEILTEAQVGGRGMLPPPQHSSHPEPSCRGCNRSPVSCPVGAQLGIGRGLGSMLMAGKACSEVLLEPPSIILPGKVRTTSFQMTGFYCEFYLQLLSGNSCRQNDNK